MLKFRFDRRIRSMKTTSLPWPLSIGSLSKCVFDTRTATGSELFSPLTCLHATAFTSPSIFSPLEVISIKIWETPLSWDAKCSLPVAVPVSKTRVLKVTNINRPALCSINQRSKSTV